MEPHVKTKVALIGGAAVVALAAGVGGVLLSDTSTPTPIATPTSTVAPAPTSPTTAGTPAPATDGNVPGGSTGCIPHANC